MCLKRGVWWCYVVLNGGNGCCYGRAPPALVFTVREVVGLGGKSGCLEGLKVRVLWYILGEKCVLHGFFWMRHGLVYERVLFMEWL